MSEVRKRGPSLARASDPAAGPRRRRLLLALLAAAIILVVALLLRRELAGYSWREVLAQLDGYHAGTLAAALVTTASSYALLACCDLLGLRYLGKRVGPRRLLAASFVAYAFNHNLGLSALTGGAVRYRFYSPRGLGAQHIAQLAAFCAMSTLLGLASVAGTALLLAGAPAVAGVQLGRIAGMALGVALLAVPAGYLAWSALARRPLNLRWLHLSPPVLRIALPQWLVAVVELLMAAGTLWLLLPLGMKIAPLAFAGLYAVAVIAGIISTVPGGLGVFELVLLAGLGGQSRESLLGALLAYRAIYYLLPLCLAGLLLAWAELRQLRQVLAVTWRRVQLLIAPLAPAAGSALVFAGGVVLLISGATPAIDERLVVLRRVVPLPLLELSHLAGSVIGLLLLVVARALLRRSAAAWQLTLWLLAAGALASLFKGLDFEEALLLGVVGLVLWTGRAAFYRQSSLTQERLSRGWVVSVVGVVALSLLVGWMSNDVRYSSELFWTFGRAADAPRSLRASLLVLAALLALMLANLLRPPRAPAHRPERLDLQRARLAMADCSETICNAALTGDKRLLFLPEGSGFVMYQVSGRSYIAFGDPVAPRPRQRELARRFVELADQAGAWAAFYQVAENNLATYVDLGMTLAKLGEEARVRLADFSLEGATRADLRQTHRRALRAGLDFRIVPADEVPGRLPLLRAISESWLEGKAAAEKGFSVGAYSDAYIQQFPVALVSVEGLPVAFANLWTTADRAELSVDLMRFSADAPRNTMDFLFIELMLWARAESYGWFNLGMAPLAGLDPHALAPAWHRLGNFVFRHGEHFYNFEGLRRYKEKFAPEWSPRYLAAPSAWVLPWVLLDASRLISGGLKGMVSR